MMHSRAIAFGLAAIGIFSFSTMAAAVEPTPRWAGFYSGALLGYGFGKAPTTVTPDDVAVQHVFLPYFVPEVSPHLHAVTGGAEVGYDVRHGAIVAGLVTDLSSGTSRGKDVGTAIPGPGGTFVTEAESKLNWYGSLRGRLGVLATDNLLLFGTGGLAYGDVETTTTGSNKLGCATGRFYCMSGNSGGISVGAVVGVGLEYALSPNWTTSLEYLSIRLHDKSTTFEGSGTPAGTFTADTSFKMQTARLGIFYKFGN
jgi:outer membrane immunogenic protein